jgi:hypothetical protein
MGEVQFHGMTAIAVGGAPRGSPLLVYGERMGVQEESIAGCWRYIDLDVQPGVPIAHSEEAGLVAVDWARLMFVDADTLGAWQHEKPLDGLADFVFWGRDARQAAEKAAASLVGEGTFGWLGRPPKELVPLAIAVEEDRQQRGLRFATDFRPHSHHYFMMKQVRERPTASGTLEVGGAKCCGFHTAWGDGFYPVLQERDVDGKLVRIRIHLGTTQTADRLRRLRERER